MHDCSLRYLTGKGSEQVHRHWPAPAKRPASSAKPRRPDSARPRQPGRSCGRGTQCRSLPFGVPRSRPIATGATRPAPRGRTTACVVRSSATISTRAASSHSTPFLYSRLVRHRIWTHYRQGSAYSKTHPGPAERNPRPPRPGDDQDLMQHFARLEAALGSLAELDRGLIRQLFSDGRCGRSGPGMEVSQQAVSKRKQKSCKSCGVRWGCRQSSTGKTPRYFAPGGYGFDRACTIMVRGT